MATLKKNLAMCTLLSGTCTHCWDSPEPPLLQTEQTQLSQPCFIGEMFLPFTGLSTVCPHLSCAGEAWTGHSSLDVESRRIISICNPVFCLMHPRIPLGVFEERAHFWLMFNLFSVRIPRFFPDKLLSSWVHPACPGAWECSSPGAGLHVSPCWTLLLLDEFSCFIKVSRSCKAKIFLKVKSVTKVFIEEMCATIP